MRLLLVLSAFIALSPWVDGFCIPAIKQTSPSSCRSLSSDNVVSEGSRRGFFYQVSSLISSVIIGSARPGWAAVGSLPEFSDTSAVLQGMAISVTDQSQQKAMITFLEDGFGFKVLRQRIQAGVEETWLGFGPEQLSIPSDFVLPVSSFSQYGGHASIKLVYDSKATSLLYRIGDNAPGNNIAFLQVAVPNYRISQMVKNGGNVLDAYGIVNVVSPSGLPMRGIIGIWPDPVMFVAINCIDVQRSKTFYEKLGFTEREYPYARPSKGTGQFEPPQPPKSVYMAPSANSMGVLLLPSKKKKIIPNPVVQSLNIVYQPSDDSDRSDAGPIIDPSGLTIAFQPVEEFEKEEQATR